MKLNSTQQIRYEKLLSSFIFKWLTLLSLSLLATSTAYASPSPFTNSATSSADNIDVPLTEYLRLSGRYRVAMGGISLFENANTAGNFEVDIPACANSTTPTITAAYMTWYQRWRGTNSFIDNGNLPEFDDDFSLNINTLQNQTVTYTDDHWAKLNAGTRTFIRRYAIADISSLLGSAAMPGANSFEVSDLAVASPDASNSNVSNSETFGVSSIVVYECPEFDNVTISMLSGLDFFYGTDDDPYVGDYSDLACTSFPAASVQQTIQLDAIFGGQASASAPFRGNRLFYQSGSGAIPSTDSTQPTGPSGVIVSGGTQLGSGYEDVWRSNLGTEWDYYNNTATVNVGDEWLCIQAESIEGEGSGRGVSGDILSPVFTISTTNDFGDAPAPYNTTSATNGASHIVVDGVRLGSVVDTEADGQPGIGADDDGADEDGVVFYNTAVPGRKLYFSALSETMGHRINAWIDWNGDGIWDSSEQILSDHFGLNFPDIRSVDVPLTAVAGTTYARFRICNATNSCNSPEGAVDNGEVEDYRLVIAEVATLGDFVWLDDNNNGVQDSGEMGVQHVVVKLFTADGTLVEQTLTDVNGAYHFNTQAGTDYYLEFMNPSPNGYAFTQQGAGITSTDSDANPITGRTITFTAIPGDDPDWDAGLVAAVNTQTHCASHLTSRTNWNDDLIVNQFDPALGTLQNVDITTSCLLEQIAGVESTDAAANQIGYDTTADVTLTKPDGSTQACNMNYSERFDSTAFDGVSNYAGTSGTAWVGRPFQGHAVETYTPVADFIGAGTVTLPAASNAASAMFGPGNTGFSVLTDAGASVCVTYIYEKAAGSDGALTITKVVAGDPGSVTDYDVTIEGPDGYINNTTVTTDSPVVLTSLADGAYTVTETSSGSDWLAGYEVVNGTGTTSANNAVVNLMAGAPGTNLLTNGSFEDFTGSTNNSWPDRVVSTNLDGWAVSAAPAHLVFDQSVSTAPNPPVYYSAAEGEYFLNAFSRNSTGTIVQQSFDVTAGKDYCLSFNYSWGVKFSGSRWIDVPEDGYFDVQLTGALTSQQSFTGAASDVDTSADPNASEVNPVAWRYGSMVVNAAATGTATLSIQALSSGSGWEAQFLDNVAIRECATAAEATVQITNDFNPAAPQVDLELTKTINTTSAKRGDSVVYTLTVTNQGADDATGVVVNDKLPTGLTYTGHTPAASNYDPANGDWTVGNVPASQSVTLEIGATVN